MYLKADMEVTRAARPSRKRVRREAGEVLELVKGAAMVASASLDKLRPTSACLRAEQSLLPSPTMAVLMPSLDWKKPTRLAFWSGFMRAKTLQERRMRTKSTWSKAGSEILA